MARRNTEISMSATQAGQSCDVQAGCAESAVATGSVVEPRGDGQGSAAAPGASTVKAATSWASANAAWIEFGQHRWEISRRTFYNYVGPRANCKPRADGRYHADDIVKIAQAAGWRPHPSVRPGTQGGEGGKGDGDTLLRERIRRERLRADNEELDLRKRRGELVERREMERLLAAAVVVLENEMMNWVHEKARGIIHLVGGDPRREQDLVDHLREGSRRWLHQFSMKATYRVEVHDDADWDGGWGDDDEEKVTSADARAAAPGASAPDATFPPSDDEVIAAGGHDA